MNIRKIIAKQFVSLLVKTPEGRAHLLNQIAESEEKGEVRMFDEAIALVDDDKLKKIIDLHRNDEIRHGEMFREALDRNGVPVEPVPDNLDVLTQLDVALGGFFDRGLKDTDDLMRAYVILQVIEERALDQFGMYGEVFNRIDPETAETFRLVEKDEARHLKYCKAIALRYAKSTQDYERELSQVRDVEARTFREVQSANVDYILDNDLAPSFGAKIFFRVMQVLGRRVEDLPYTQFATPVMVVA